MSYAPSNVVEPYAIVPEDFFSAAVAESRDVEELV
jgi:hypothetical protein